MNHKTTPYHVVDFPPERRGMAAFQELKAGRHCMYALLEVDVTDIRKFIEDYKAKTGEQLSFTGYLISCLARAVDEDKTVQSYRKGSKQLVIFDDVDVGFMIEMKKGEKRFLTGRVIRAANCKTFWEINQEIRAVQSSRMLSDAEKDSWFRSAMLLPWPLSGLFKSLFRMIEHRDPTIVTSMAGTVGISSVGMFGKGHSGWGISSGSHSLDLIAGGTARKMSEVDERIEPRDILSLTIIFDHDVIDGAPAARFTRRLIELIESGYGLDQDQTPAIDRKLQSNFAMSQQEEP
ncbi:MAG: 2-oxo acid dehydrogenase subunit E2 [Anaerolineae bacterium]|nr:2-oxo acid dehydrogenase subunit E2 [Anaerolineae bacterium]